LLRFHYRYVLPYNSLIELGNSQAVLDMFKKTENDKWQEHIDAKEELTRLETIAKGLPFAKNHEIHYALFLREKPKNPNGVRIYYPDEVMRER
jgi:hypothetical protein